LTLVGLVVPNDTNSRTRSSMSDHVTGYSPDYGTFDAAFGMCRGSSAPITAPNASKTAKISNRFIKVICIVLFQ
jgi:hypothetical protein